MASKLGKDAKAAFEIANLLDDAADAIRKRSKRAYGAGRMSLEEYMEARARELELRSEVSVIVATNLGDALEVVSEAGENIGRAITDAQARVNTVRSVKGGLRIVTALISLAAALAASDVKNILKAGRAVADVL